MPFLEKDAMMYPYIEAVKQLIIDNVLVLAVNKKVQDIWDID